MALQGQPEQPTRFEGASNLKTPLSKWPENGHLRNFQNVNNVFFLSPIRHTFGLALTMVAGNIAKALFRLLFDTAHCSSGGKDNGFGNNYVWAGSLESGLQIATNHNKPVMVIIHKSWCTACKNLKPKFASSPEIQSLSKHFVMVNLVDEEEPKSASFAPDGTYIPRILFISPQGLVDNNIYNEEGSSQHKFFYSRPEQIAKSMRRVLEKYRHEKFDV